MPKQERAEITRRSIIRGAAEVFDRYGYAAATLSDVIGHGGVTKGALYFHFKSKEEVARAVVEEQHRLSVGPTREWVAESGSGLEAAIRATQLLANQLTSNVIVRAGIRLTLEQGTFGALQIDPYVEWVAVVKQLMQRAIDEGDVRSPVGAEELARFLCGAFTGIQMLSEVFTKRVDLRRRVEEMWTILFPSLVPTRKIQHFRRIVAAFPELDESSEEDMVS
jgi:AcrR family transcriptional regulator